MRQRCIAEVELIVAKPKPLTEILDMIEGYSNVLVAGCGTCVAVCLAGGEKETKILASSLELAASVEKKDKQFRTVTIERQCDREFLRLIEGDINDADAVVSLACGAGIQFLAQMYDPKPVFPGVDTCFIGVSEGAGVWSERCRSCNQCYLGITGGICPVTMCAKGLLNGPCGGPSHGKCETDPIKDCAWVQIIERLERQSRLDLLNAIAPPMKHELRSHPARIERGDYRITMSGEAAERAGDAARK